MNDILVKVGADITDFSRKMAESQKSLKDFTKNNQETFDSFKKVGAGVTAVGTGIAVGLGGAVKIAANFESEMSKVGAISGATGDDMAKLSEKAREMGSMTKFSASESAQGFQYMAMAGWKTGDMLDGIEGIMSLAAAAGEDLALTSDIVTDALTAFGMTAKDSGKLADIMAAASSNANTNVAMLGESFKYVAPLAGAMGYSAEDVSVALGLMANAGIKSSQAGTTLKTMMANLAKPTKQMKKSMTELGISLTDSEGKMKPFSQVTDDLRGAFDGLTETQQAQHAATIFGKEAMAGALAVINASEEDYTKLSEAINNSEGAAQTMAEAMQDNLMGALTNLNSAFEEIMIAIGSALLPVIKDAVGFVQGLADKFNALDDSTKETIAKVAAITAGFALLTGPLLLLVGFIPQIIKGFGAVKTVFTALTGPIGLTVAAIGLIVGALVLAYNKVDWFRDMVDAAWAKIKEIFAKAIEGIKELLDKLKEFWAANGEGILNTAKEKFTAVGESIRKIVEDVVNFVKGLLDKFKAFWDENGKAILTLVKSYFNHVAESIKGVMGVIKGVFEVVWPLISGIVQTAWKLIKATVSTAIDAVLGVIQTVMKAIQGDWKGAWETIKDTGKSIWDGIKRIFDPAEMLQIGKDIINGLIKGVSSMADAAIETVRGIGRNIMNTFKNLLDINSPSGEFEDFGIFIMQGLNLGINSQRKNTEKAITGAATILSNVAKSNVADIAKITKQAEKERLAVQDEYAKKRAELAKKTATSSQNAIKTHKNKKGEIIVKGEQKAQQIRRDASDKLVKLNEDEAKKLDKIAEKLAADTTKRESELAKDRLTALKTYIDDKKSMEELTLVAESEIWRKSLVLFEAGTKERVDAQKAYQATLNTINDEILKTNEEYAGKMTAISDKLRDEERKLTDEYEKSVNDRANSLKNFVGVFDFFEVKIEKTGAELLSNLTSQVHGFKRWQQEIDALATKAIDKGLLEELRAMGPKALPELIALNSMSDKQLTQYSALYREKSKLAREQAEKELIGMKADTKKRIDELRATANRELETLRGEWVAKIRNITRTTDDEFKTLKSIGVNAGRGLNDGLASMESTLLNTARSIANSISREISNALKVKSPSRVMMEIGRFVGEGLNVGMKSQLSDIIATANRMADAVLPDIGTPQIAGYDVPSGVRAGMSRSLEANASNGLSSSTQNIIVQPAPIYLDGQVIGEAVFDVVDTRMESNRRSQLRYGGMKL